MTAQRAQDHGGSVTAIIRRNLCVRIAELNDAGNLTVGLIAADPDVSELLYALELLAAPVREAA